MVYQKDRQSEEAGYSMSECYVAGHQQQIQSAKVRYEIIRCEMDLRRKLLHKPFPRNVGLARCLSLSRGVVCDEYRGVPDHVTSLL